MKLIYLHTEQEMIDGCSASYNYKQICHIEDGTIIAAIDENDKILYDDEIVSSALIIDNKLKVILK